MWLNSFNCGKYTIKTQEICLQISAVLGERVYVVKKKAILVKTWHTKFCNTNFSVAAGALYDVKRLAKRSTIVTAVEASSKTKSITNFVDDKKSSSVILSETLFSNFVAEHNLPFSLADHFTKSLPKLCK